MLDVSILCMTQAVGDCCANEGLDHCDAHSNILPFFSKTFYEVTRGIWGFFHSDILKFSLAKDKNCLNSFFYRLYIHLVREALYRYQYFLLVEEFFHFWRISLWRNKQQYMLWSSEQEENHVCSIRQNITFDSLTLWRIMSCSSWPISKTWVREWSGERFVSRKMHDFNGLRNAMTSLRVSFKSLMV